MDNENYDIKKIIFPAEVRTILYNSKEDKYFSRLSYIMKDTSLYHFLRELHNDYLEIRALSFQAPVEGIEIEDRPLSAVEINVNPIDDEE